MIKRADEWYREKVRREAEEAKHLLLQYRDEIEKRISEIREFSSFEIAGFSSSEIGNVEQVLSLTFRDIQSATWKERDENGGRILFSLKTELTVVTSRFSWEHFNATFQIGGQKFIPTFAPPTMEQKRVDKYLYGEASFVNRNGKLELVELRIDKILPTEDLAKLVGVELS